MKFLKHLLVAGFASAVALGSVQAEITQVEVNSAQRPDNGSARARNSSIYIVQLKGDPVVAYSGEIAGYAATKPARGEKLAANASAVEKYAGRLVSIQNDIIASVGAEKVYNYRYVFNGFAARMTADAAAALRKRPDVVSVNKDVMMPMNTNNTPAWIHVSGEGEAWYKGYTGEDVVVASVDTGIWPEHPSFRDQRTPILGNFGPLLYLNDSLPDFYPSGCDFGNTAANPSDAPFNCNRKLVTARCYNGGFSTADDPSNPCGGNGVGTNVNEFQSARDRDGHGSHTISTAAGNYGVPAWLNHEYQGKVSGIAPRARVATYKVCWDGPDDSVTTDDGCYPSDSMAAVDQAVYDGADVINFSVGGSGTFFGGDDDIAFLFANLAGVFVATSNGNAGPGAQTTGTPAGVPWITSVGATHDGGVFYSAINVNAPVGVAGPYVAVEGAGDVALTTTITADVVPVDDSTGVGNDGCEALTNGAAVSGNIALVIRGACSFTTKYNTAADAGAVAIIVYNDGTDPSRYDPFVMSAPGTTIPGFMIGYEDGDLLNGTAEVNATMDPANEVSAANRIAGFSSRGPNGGSPDIIKPDVSAPGVAILAAASPASGGELFMSINGTSMASPHAAGAFALLKQKYPNWSPAQAKSALMTSGRQNLKKTFGDDPADPFDIGSGEILPTMALSPGLTYDADFFDFLDYLCGEPLQSGIVNCGSFPGIDPSDLNMASIGIADLVGSQTVTRTVTSVAKGSWKRRKSRTTFKAVVDAPPGIEILLSDWELSLRNGESATYDITFNVKNHAKLNEWAFGSITWVEKYGDARVRSTVAVKPVQINADSEVDGSGSSGSLDVEVQFGYTGEFDNSVTGLNGPSYILADNVSDGGFDGWCVGPFPAGAHMRFATYDDDTSDPGNDDIDLEVYYTGAGCTATTSGFVGSSGGVTSEEIVDLPNSPAGNFVVFVDGYAASNGTDTDYAIWFQLAFGGDQGNTSVSGPSSATAGDSTTVTVDYSGLPATRMIGILHHEDGDGTELARTILDVDAR